MIIAKYQEAGVLMKGILQISVLLGAFIGVYMLKEWKEWKTVRRLGVTDNTKLDS